MPYKISGTKSETARVMVLKESDWSIESNTVVSGSGAYEIDSLVTGDKTVVARSSEGEMLGYGDVSSVYYSVPELWVWGRNQAGQLGLGDIDHRSSPVQVGALTDWSSLAIGVEDNTFAIKTDGTFWVWGSNPNGALGLGDTNKRSSPAQVGALTNWSQASCGGQQSVGFKTDGTVWTWGRNTYGSLGNGTITYESSPIQVGALTDWSSVISHNYCVLATKTDGTLWAWGRGSEGGLGLGDINHRSSPVQVGLLTNWSSLGSSYGSTTAIKTDGTLWAWGYNNYGQLGNNTITDESSPVQIGALTDWDSVSAGDGYFNAAIKTDGTLWAWGDNTYGQLGQEDITHYSSPVQIGSGTNWSSVDSGVRQIVVLKDDGTLWVWGGNDFGQLCQGDITHRSSPVQVAGTWSNAVSGYLHMAALK